MKITRRRFLTALVRTNEKGVSGKWRQVSWATALGIVGGRSRTRG